MVDREPRRKRPFSQQMVSEWYTDFVARTATGAGTGQVIYDALDTPHPSLNIVVGIAAVVCWGVSRISRNRMIDNLSHAEAEAEPTPEARNRIQTEMRNLSTPRLMAALGGGFVPLAAESTSPYGTIFFGTVAAGVILEGEHRLVQSGRKVVQALKESDGRPPLFDRAR